jgi:cytochrome c-type biogenesis protein CcmH
MARLARLQPLRWLTLSTLKCALVCVLLFAARAGAVIESYDFANDAEQARYQHFVDELRCPKCQNQNLAGSNSPIAADLRRELHRMIVDGKNDDYILNFMVARYGEFVLYRPRLDRNTAILWSAPAILAVIGLMVIVVILRNQRRRAADVVTGATLTDAEQQQLQALLERFCGE